jgi:uncharacterized protein (TIGR00255 family)
MTGFGDASAQIDGIHYAVEVRSLNNRYFKSTIRLPEQIAGLEAELEALLRRLLHRGSITLIVKTRLSDALATQRVNDSALLNYLDHLATIRQKLNQDQSIHIDLTSLLALPGVLQPSEDEESLLARARPNVLRLVEQACNKLHAMRQVEGRTIADDLLQQRTLILERLEGVAARAPKVVEEYHVRLRQRVDDLLARAALKVSETDLLREVALFAERADIAEEVSRLAGHLDQFGTIIGSADQNPAGRTLDFLAQELLREANTIASKSNDVQIARAIVEVKGAIDRIKEQVQNVA